MHGVQSLGEKFTHKRARGRAEWRRDILAVGPAGAGLTPTADDALP